MQSYEIGCIIREFSTSSHILFKPPLTKAFLDTSRCHFFSTKAVFWLAFDSFGNSWLLYYTVHHTLFILSLFILVFLLLIWHFYTSPIKHVSVQNQIILWADSGLYFLDITGESEVTILKLGRSSAWSDCSNCGAQYWPCWSIKHKTRILGPGRSGLKCTLAFCINRYYISSVFLFVASSKFVPFQIIFSICAERAADYISCIMPLTGLILTLSYSLWEDFNWQEIYVSSAWSPLHLGKILWRGTCCNLCNWCFLSIPFWRFKICSWYVHREEDLKVH